MTTGFRLQRRRVSLTFGSVYLAIFLIGLSTDLSLRRDVSTAVFSALVIADSVFAALTVRAFGMATIKADTRGLVIRGFLRTRRFRWDEVKGYSAVPSRSGLSGRRGITPMIELADGRQLRLGEFFLPDNKVGRELASRLPLALAQMNQSAHGGAPNDHVP